MKEFFIFLRDIPKMISSSDGLESMMGIIVVCMLTPIVLLIGLGVFKLIELILK
jgi:hypothetical protein